MLRRTKCVLVLGASVALMGFNRSSFADLLVTTGNDYSTTASSGAWPTNPANSPLSSAMYDSLTPGGLPSSATTAQGLPAPAGGATYTMLSEIVNPTTTFTLTDIDVVGSGGGGSSMLLRLFPLTSNPGGQSSSASYNLADESSTDLLGGGNGLAFAFNGFSGQRIVDFTLTTAPSGSTAGDDSGNDQVVLDAGTTYALELWAPNNSTFFWGRTGANALADGQLMGSTNAAPANSRTTLANLGLAGASRPGAVELYGVAVPEPTSLSLIGMGAIGLLARRRKA